MAIASAYYSQNQSFYFNSLVISSIIGISTSIILFCSHFHQVEDDLKAGKKIPYRAPRHKNRGKCANNFRCPRLSSKYNFRIYGAITPTMFINLV